ncbi:MAG TPA: hypothetical protein VJC03_09175, partial [bacterium]|nr:hypothetical protein [bacterium]
MGFFLLNTPLFSAITVETINFSDSLSTSSLHFSPQGQVLVISDQYMKIDLSGENNALWRMDIFTDNSDYSAENQKGGLIGTSTSSLTHRAPLLWQIYPSTAALSSLSLSTSSIARGDWAYLKDLGDTDW